MEKNTIYDPLTNTRQYRWLGFTTFMHERGRRVSSKVQTIMDLARTALNTGANRRDRQAFGRSAIASHLQAPSAFRRLMKNV